jgi:hypothetical protein
MDQTDRKISFVFLIFFISFLINVIVSFQWPRTGGDWDAYGTVAENIYHGHGVSLSNGPPYEPHFGGNSFPGYPAFLALSWTIFGKNHATARVAQSFLFAVGVAFFSFVLNRIFNNHIGIYFGLFTAISPLTTAWSRSLQVEAVSMASIMLFFGFLFISIDQRRLQWIVISLSILFAAYIRTDGVLLFVPLFAFAFVADVSWLRKTTGLLVISGIVVLGLGSWFVRNAMVGMEKITPPTMLVLKNGEVMPTPNGYLLWGWTWMSKEYERGGWGFPVTRAGYDTIYIPEAAYDNDHEKDRVSKLLNELETYKGKAFPEHIDKQFHAIAIEKIQKNPFRVFVVLPLKRMFALWFHPGSSAGWPLEMTSLSYEERTKLERDMFSGALYLLKTRPIKIIGKGVVLLTTLFVQIMGMIGLFLLFKSRYHTIGLAILSYFVIRTAFYGFTNNVESRYLAQIIPLLQFLTVYSLVTLKKVRKNMYGYRFNR